MALDYMQVVVVLSGWITLAALWLLSMMLVRILVRQRLRDGVAGADWAAVCYVLGTVVVFGTIALRYGAQLPPWVVLVILFLKAVSVTGIGWWVRAKMRAERLP